MKITYLIGAGASANAVPCVEKMNADLGRVGKEFMSRKYPPTRIWNETGVEYSINNIFEQIGLGLQTLSENAIKKGSVDRYAKWLFDHSSEKELDKLRALLMVYLSFVQLENPVDNRYEKFWQEILQGGDLTKFPEYVNIVSWNYDNQFEMGFYQYAQQPLHSSHIHVKGSMKNVSRINPKFGIYKINGANVFTDTGQKRREYTMFDIRAPFNEDAVVEIGRRYLQLTISARLIDSGISFAWEDSDNLGLVKSAVSASNILVIIGYSFPNFNKKIDNGLFASMGSTLQTIFIQDLKPAEVRESLPNISTARIVEYKKPNFHIPNEFFDY